MFYIALSGYDENCLESGSFNMITCFHTEPNNKVEKGKIKLQSMIWRYVNLHYKKKLSEPARAQKNHMPDTCSAVEL